MTGLRRLWQHHRAALLAFAVAALITAGFAVRFTVATIYWSDPAHRQLHPEAWMTPGFLARSWNLPRAEVAQALGLVPEREQGRTLAEIAAARGAPLAAFLAEVEATVSALDKARQGQ